MNVDKIKEYAKLTRLKAMGISTIAVVGAISIKGTLEISHFLILFFIGIIFNILGFVLNDYVDIDIDKESKDLSERPLVKGTISRKTALRISISCYILIFSLAFIFFRDFLSLLMLTLAVSLGTIYDCFGKKFLGSDFVLAAGIAFFCLFGAATASPNIGMLTMIIASLIFTHVLFFNIIEGGLKDADNDRRSGAKTTAVYMGVKTESHVYIPKKFKVLALSIEFTSAILVFLPFLIFPEIYLSDFWYLQIIALLVLTISLFLSIVKMLNIKSFDRQKVTMIITKHEIKRYIIVPVILMSFCDIRWLLIILSLPTIWYLSFTIILHDKPFRRRLL